VSSGGKIPGATGVPLPVPAPSESPSGPLSVLRDEELAARFDDLVETRRARVAVVGVGCVGLPLALALWRAGFQVEACDVDAARLARLARGESPLAWIDASLVAEMAASERFCALSGAGELGAADAVLLCLPTPLDAGGEPDLSRLYAVGRELARVLRPGQLVVLESTTWPGTTREVLLPLLLSSGLRPGLDFWLAYSPEREDPGARGRDLASIPKLVAGLDPASAERARRLYAAAIREVHPVSRPEVAEAAKLLENTFRAVNIALVNELKLVLERLGIDVWEVIEAAATKPFGFMKFTPGPGMGGHCIPVDPLYLAWAARRAGTATRFVELAAEINRRMPEQVVERTLDLLTRARGEVRGARVLLLGIAYKPEVDATHESPALRLLELLASAGVRCRYSDPWVPEAPEGARAWLEDPRSLALDARVLADFDAVLVATDHAAFDWAAIARDARLVVDTRNALGAHLSGDPRYHRA
jgi:UDP-N-acetyl-D-glucosamine dehydrogenase